jgi:hypothetical protein
MSILKQILDTGASRQRTTGTTMKIKGATEAPVPGSSKKYDSFQHRLPARSSDSLGLLKSSKVVQNALGRIV